MPQIIVTFDRLDQAVTMDISYITWDGGIPIARPEGTASIGEPQQ